MNQLAIEYEEKAKKRGMKRAETAHYRDVQIARQEAWKLAQILPYVHMDDVRAYLALYHPDIIERGIGNWAGSVFRRPEWVPVGFVQSTHKGGHRRMIRTWKLA